jgi:hypothetical protein
MSLQESQLTLAINNYIPRSALTAIRAKVYQANDLHTIHNNNEMSEALLAFCEAIKAELVYGKEPVVEAKVDKKKEKTAPVVPEVEEDDGEMLFDSRAEAIEALDMPADKSSASAMTKENIIKVVYGVGNEDPSLYLKLPSKDAASAMKKKDLLTIIYGE